MFMGKKIVLGFGIAIVFAALVHYGICTFFPQPKWENYQVKNYHRRHKRATFQKKETLEKEKNEKKELLKEHREKWSTIYFYIGLPVGTIAIITGTIIALPAIGVGLLGGGLLVLINSYGHYWMFMTDLPKFISLAVVFIILLWVGYRKIEKK